MLIGLKGKPLAGEWIREWKGRFQNDKDKGKHEWVKRSEDRQRRKGKVIEYEMLHQRCWKGSSSSIIPVSIYVGEFRTSDLFGWNSVGVYCCHYCAPQEQGVGDRRPIYVLQGIYCVLVSWRDLCVWEGDLFWWVGDKYDKVSSSKELSLCCLNP